MCWTGSPRPRVWLVEVADGLYILGFGGHARSVEREQPLWHLVVGHRVGALGHAGRDRRQAARLGSVEITLDARQEA